MKSSFTNTAKIADAIWITVLVGLFAILLVVHLSAQTFFFRPDPPVRSSSATNSQVFNSSGPSIIQTNWNLNQVYNNGLGSAVIVMGTASLTSAAVVGAAELDMLAGAPGQITNTVFSIRQATGVSAITGSNTVPFSIFIPAGASFILTNSSIGIGNSVTIQPGTGWVIIN